MRDTSLQPFVSVIVPVYNDAVRLRRCLDALERQTYPSDRYEVVVVDNGSSVPLTTVPGHFAHAHFEREPQPGNSRARVTGIARATGEVFAFTDADCVPDSRWIACGVSRLVDTPGCGLVGGHIEVVPEDPEQPNVATLVSVAMHLKQQRFLEEGHWASFANAFTSRHVMETVGAMNVALMSSGEVEWGRRTQAAGFAQVYAPDVIVRHPARTSIRALCRRTIRLEVGWAQLRDLHGIGGGVLHWIGQYLFRPVLATYLDVVRNRRLTWRQRTQASALSCVLVIVRMGAYALMKAGWRVDVRERWG